MPDDAPPPTYNLVIAQPFDNYGLREWNRLLKTPVDEVSLHIHIHYLGAYVQPDARVLAAHLEGG